MNNARIWLVVKPSVGLPLLLGAVLLIALLVHGAVMLNSSWYPAYFEGSAAVTGAQAALESSAEAVRNLVS